MGSFQRCKYPECKNPQVLLSKFCWDHDENKKEHKENLKKYLKNRGSLKGANLSKANLSDLDLSRLDLSGANLYRADLSDANLFDANLRKAELLGADLSGADLTEANLRGSDLTRCNLSGARLWHASLENANLIEANLHMCDLWNAKLANARIWRTNLSTALSISKKSFLVKSKKYFSAHKIDERGAFSAEDAYRDLKKYFLATGRYNDASWASFKEKTMERLHFKKKKNFLAYSASLVMNLLCGYGEKPQRIIFSSFLVIVLFSLLYGVLDTAIYADFPRYAMTAGDYLYYSIITFTTLGYGDFIPKAAFLPRLIAASESFIGAFMIGLFIFTLARRYSAR
jgi:hypothetical protein